MKKVLAVLAYAAFAACVSTSRSGNLHIDAPLGLDFAVPVPADNPLTSAAVALGERLFFDARLSADGTISCASCHRPEYAFADTSARSIGILHRTGKRNAPSLLNAVYLDELFWDGRAASLEQQVLMPLTDSLEMGRSLTDVEQQLQRSGRYAGAFAHTYGRAANAEDLARALASYIRTLRSGNSRVDRFEAGDSTALSPSEIRGRALFMGKARCRLCHIGSRFTDGEFHATRVSSGRDPGRYAVTGDSAEHFAFRTPGLRDVARTAPYMHDGSITTLADVIEFYDRGGGPGVLDLRLRPLHLTPDEKRDLVAFLGATSGLPAR